MASRVGLVVLVLLAATAVALACGGSADTGERPASKPKASTGPPPEERPQGRANSRLAARFRREYMENLCPANYPELQVSWCDLLISVTLNAESQSVTLDTELHPDDEGRMFAEQMCPSVWGLVNTNSSPYTVEVIYIYSHGEPFELCRNPLG